MERLDSFKGKATISSFRDRIEGYKHNADTSVERVNTNDLALITEKPKEPDELDHNVVGIEFRLLELKVWRRTKCILSSYASSAQSYNGHFNNKTPMLLHRRAWIGSNHNSKSSIGRFSRFSHVLIAKDGWLGGPELFSTRRFKL